jgi:hypothetical protein
MDDFDKVRFWTTPTSKCASQNDACVPYYRWVSDYIGVIGGRKRIGRLLGGQTAEKRRQNGLLPEIQVVQNRASSSTSLVGRAGSTGSRRIASLGKTNFT